MRIALYVAALSVKRWSSPSNSFIRPKPSTRWSATGSKLFAMRIWTRSPHHGLSPFVASACSSERAWTVKSGLGFWPGVGWVSHGLLLWKLGRTPELPRSATEFACSKTLFSHGNPLSNIVLRPDAAPPPLCPARHPPQSVAACLSIVARRILSRMGTKSRETIYGASVRAAAERATEARKEADRLACRGVEQAHARLSGSGAAIARAG